MFLVKLITLVVFAGNLLGVDANIEVFFDDILMDKIDPNYVTGATAFVSDESGNENAVVANFTLIKSFPGTAQGHLEVIGASMGEYSLPTGFDFEMDLCDMLEEPVMVGPFLKGLGFSECPPPPGLYGTSGYHLPTDELPDEFPPNKYQVLFYITDNDATIMRVVFFIEIQ